LGKLPEHPRKSRADKDKKKVDEARPTTPLAANAQSTLRIVDDPEEAMPLKKKRFEDQVDPQVERPDPMMKGNSSREGSVVEEIEAASKVAASTQDALYKKAFKNILASARKFLGTSLTIQEVLLKGEG
jgi:DNA-directed RNA polymerase subunit H (RpoH/RPB5)